MEGAWQGGGVTAAFLAQRLLYQEIQKTLNNFESATSTKFLVLRLLSEEIQKTLNSNFESSPTNYYPPKAFGF